MKSLSGSFLLLVVVSLVGLSGCASMEGKQAKTLYHINEGNDQAANGLRNARNHLTADPSTHLIFVAHSKGIDFLLDGAKDKNGNAYAALVDDLVAKGVEFRVCENTLQSRKIEKDKVITNVTIVPSGVAEIGRLQNKEGYAYFKP